MPLTDAEKKLLEELQAKAGDPEEEKSARRAKWIDEQMEAQEKAKKEAEEKKKKDEEDAKKKKKSRFF